MKEATGELNMTVITVVAIAAVGAFFYAIVWPAIKKNVDNATKCSAAICPSNCGSLKECDCTYYNGSSSEPVKCKNANQ